MTLSKRLSVSVLEFIHLKNEQNHGSHFAGLLRESKQITQAKNLEQRGRQYALSKYKLSSLLLLFLLFNFSG